MSSEKWRHCCGERLPKYGEIYSLYLQGQ